MNAWILQAELVRYPPGVWMAPHAHDSSSLCLTVVGGYTEEIRGRSTTHTSGHLLYCPAHEPHSQRFSVDGATKVVVRPGDAAIEFLREHLALAEAPYVYSSDFLRIGIRLCEELERADAFSNLVMEGLVFEALGNFCRTGARTSCSSKLRALRALVIERSALEVSTADLARELGEDPVELTAAFREAFGESLGQYARNARLATAARRLADTKEPVAQIAVDCGFYDQAHFTRAFRTRFGLTPARYRKTMN